MPSTEIPTKLHWHETECSQKEGQVKWHIWVKQDELTSDIKMPSSVTSLGLPHWLPAPPLITMPRSWESEIFRRISCIICHTSCTMYSHIKTKHVPYSALTLLIGWQTKHSACYYHLQRFFYRILPSVLWYCWFGIRKSIQPVKNWVVSFWRGYLSAARCKWLAYSPAGATDTRSSVAS